MGILVSEPSSRAPAPLVEQLRERLEVEENSRQQVLVHLSKTFSLRCNPTSHSHRGFSPVKRTANDHATVSMVYLVAPEVNG